jgi:hypothetical protein
MTKAIKKRVNKNCAVCGNKIKVIIYTDKSYRGGHYFGKIPLHTKKALLEALKAGFRETKIGGQVFQVMKKDPRPYKFVGYWECPKCYWGR